MTPIDVLRRWFAAYAQDDLSAAHELVADDVEVVVGETRMRGFESFMQWYRARAAEEGDSFGYRVEDLLAGETHAAAVLTLSARGRTWRQVALYRVEDDRISSIWAAEDVVDG